MTNSFYYRVNETTPMSHVDEDARIDALNECLYNAIESTAAQNNITPSQNDETFNCQIEETPTNTGIKSNEPDSDNSEKEKVDDSPDMLIQDTDISLTQLIRDTNDNKNIFEPSVLSLSKDSPFNLFNAESPRDNITDPG